MLSKAQGLVLVLEKLTERGGGDTEVHPHVTSRSSGQASPSRAQRGENWALHTLPPPSLQGGHGHLPGRAEGAAQQGRGRTGTVPQASGTGLALGQWGSGPEAARGQLIHGSAPTMRPPSTQVSWQLL